MGTNPAGNAALGNNTSGVVLAGGAHNNTSGGTPAGAGNVISGNGYEGVAFFDRNTQAKIGRATCRGSEYTSKAAVSIKKNGVLVTTSGNTNAGNTISGKTTDGVGIPGSGTMNNDV